jgi:H+/Cl- antiporter ClcA
MARWLILAGVVLLVLGLLLHYVPGCLNWFGRLPGDLRVESERGRLFLPITSMLIVSLVLTLLVNLFRR